jgi:hypothetical protein
MLFWNWRDFVEKVLTLYLNMFIPAHNTAQAETET